MDSKSRSRSNSAHSEKGDRNANKRFNDGA
jgi:hypothetical protein